MSPLNPLLPLLAPSLHPPPTTTTASPASPAPCCCLPPQVAIKKVLQDKRFKNRELAIIRMMRHPNIVLLKHCFFTTTDKDEVYLNLVLEYVPDTVYRINKHYTKNEQRMPIILVKLYTYQMLRALAHIHSIGVCHRWG